MVDIMDPGFQGTFSFSSKQNSTLETSSDLPLCQKTYHTDLHPFAFTFTQALISQWETNMTAHVIVSPFNYSSRFKCISVIFSFHRTLGSWDPQGVIYMNWSFHRVSFWMLLHDNNILSRQVHCKKDRSGERIFPDDQNFVNIAWKASLIFFELDPQLNH